MTDLGLTPIKDVPGGVVKSLFDARGADDFFGNLKTAAKGGVDIRDANYKAEFENDVPGLLREAGLYRQGAEFLLRRELRNDPEGFLNKADEDWKQRLLMAGRVVGQRAAELKAGGFPDSTIKKYLRDIARAELSGQRILHEAKFGSENLLEAERIVKTRKGIRIAATAGELEQGGTGGISSTSSSDKGKEEEKNK